MPQLATNSVEATRLTRAQRRQLEQDLQRQRVRQERLLRDDADTAGRTHATPMGGDEGNGRLTTLLHGRTAERYQSVVHALERMENGGYGLCVVCRHPISFGRLLAMPEAATCITCGPRW